MSESFQVVESEVQDQMLPELLLDFDSRKKCRFRATDSEGHVVEAFLPRGTVLTHGSVLVSDANRRVRVVAKPEPLSEVRGTAEALLPVVYHLGNRHLAVQLEGSIIRYARDHVIDGMVRHLGFEPVPVDMPFQPIDGAYKHHHQHHSHES